MEDKEKNPVIVSQSVNFKWTDKDFVEPKKYIDSLNRWVNRENVSTDWVNFTGDIGGLFQAIHDGYPVCAQLRSKDGSFTIGKPSGYKDEKYFVRSSIAFVDIDHGLTVEEALNNDFYRYYGTGYYTSPSHTEDNHRFRLVFRLQEDIETAEEMRYLYIALIEIFGGDPACKDGARMFFGSKGCDYEVNRDRYLPIEEMRALIKHGRKLNTMNVANERRIEGEFYKTVSNLWLEKDQILTLNNGSNVIAGDIQGHISNVRCPFHADSKGSEFVSVNKNGIPYLVCKKCNNGRAIWLKKEDTPSTLQAFIKKKNPEKVASKNPIDSIELEGLEGHHEIYTEKYLLPIPVLDGATFIKSPKGTGKTYQLERLVEKFKQNNKTVLLIGHRRVLLRSMAQRLQLTYYEDIKERGFRNQDTSCVAVCANSLMMLTALTTKYDVIILDECEQVIQHLAGDTARKDRSSIVPAFFNKLRNANSIYALDADMSRLSIDCINEVINDPDTIYTAQDASNVEPNIHAKPRRIYTGKTLNSIVNDIKHKGSTKLSLYETKQPLLDRLLECIKGDKKILVTSNSKKQIGEMTDYINEKYPDKRTLMITCDTNSLKQQVDFINDVNNQSDNYDIILATPTMGTGVDITTHYDCTFGIFEAHVNTHYDVDQQIHRTRNVDEINVWITPQLENKLTDWMTVKENVIANDKATSEIIDSSATKIDKQTLLSKKQSLWPYWYLNLYCRVESHRAASMNRLRYHWFVLKRDQGWEVSWIPKPEEKHQNTDDEKQKEKQARENRSQVKFDKHKNRIKLICDANVIEREVYEVLKTSKSMSITDIASLERFRIENFFKTPVTKELVTLYDDHFIEDLMKYTEYVGGLEKVMSVDKNERLRGVHITDMKNLASRTGLLYRLLKTLRLETLDAEVTITKKSENTERFIDFFVGNRKDIKRILGLTKRKDLESEPLLSIGAVLKLVGVKLGCGKRKAKTVVVDGEKKQEITRTYTLCTHTLDILNRYAVIRNNHFQKEMKLVQTFLKNVS